MTKPKFTWELDSWGIYSPWDRQSKQLPEPREITDTIPCIKDIEFGYILTIKKAKGKKIHFTIDHPPFKDSQGNIRPPFTGEVYVKKNSWDFFLGDTIWEPLGDKVGPWRLITRIDDVILADLTLKVVLGGA